MKLIFTKKFFYDDLLSPLMVCIVALLLTQGVYHFAEGRFKKDDSNTTRDFTTVSSDDTNQLFIVPGDVAPSSSGERRECFQNGTVTIEVESAKVIRCLVSIREPDFYSLLKNSYWYSGLTYQSSLPPEWSPSISIAYRRIII